MKNLTCTLDLLYGLPVHELFSFFDFVVSRMTSAMSISLTISCYITVQDDLDQHVDVTDSRLRVNIQLFAC